MADERLGINAKVYYMSGGTWGSESWTAIDRFENLVATLTWSMAPASDRGTGLEVQTKTTVGLTITGRVKVNESDSAYLAFIAVAITRTPINLLVLNGPSNSNGAAGYKGYFHVTVSGESQGMGDVIYKDVTLMPASVASTTPFKSALVSGGAPVYTDLGVPT